MSAYGELYGQVQRKLFADVAAGRSAASLKSKYIKEHGIPARMFNALRVSLDGKVASVRESQRLQQDSFRRRIDQAKRQVAKAGEQDRRQQVHQKRRRLTNLKSRLAGLEADIAAGRVRLCFGSKKLWRKQHNLAVTAIAAFALDVLVQQLSQQLRPSHYALPLGAVLRQFHPRLPRQSQQPVRVSHYLSQQRRPRFAVRPVNHRLALDAGAQVPLVSLGFGPFPDVDFRHAARARNSLTIPSANRL